MAGSRDSNRPIKFARFCNVILQETSRRRQQSRILSLFSARSDIIMNTESIWKPRKVITCVGISNDFLRFIVKPRD